MSIPGTDPRDSDVRRWTTSIWGRKTDDGPRNTYVPGPLPSTPLVNIYQWVPRLISAGVLFGGTAALLLASDQVGKVAAAAFMVVLWAAYAVPTWWKGRFGLQADGDLLRVTSARGTREVRAADVAALRYVHQGASPDFRLVTRSGDAVYVATSRLDRGHSTLFEWLRQFAPGVSYDKRSLDIRDRLVSRGLIGEYDPDR